MSDSGLVTLGSVGATYGGLSGKSGKDFGRGSGRFVTFVEVMRDARLRGRELAPVDVKAGERQNEVRRGDLLFNVSSETPEEVALAAVVDFDVPPRVYLNSFCFGYRPTRSGVVDPTFLAYLFRSRLGRRLIVGLAQGSTRYNIAKTKLMQAPILLPSFPTQQAIASSLTETDDLIASLERLITKKRAIKQGMMQELLTGHTRLPGFSGNWTTVSAGAVGTFKGGSGFPTRYQGGSASSGSYPFFKVSDMNLSGNETLMVSANNFVTEPVRAALGATAFPADSVVFAKVGAAIFLERKRILARPSCIDNNMAAFIPDRRALDPKFVYCSFNSFPFGSLVAVGALPSLNGTQLRSIPLKVPLSLEEQHAIAGALSDVDAELDALNRRLESARAIKQGMMQELLTGRTRLPVAEALS